MIARQPNTIGNGNQKSWFAIVERRTGGLVYGNGADRSVVSGAGAGTRGRCECDVRAGRADGVAHASVRPNVDRDGRLRTGAARRRTDRGNSAGRRRLVPA